MGRIGLAGLIETATVLTIPAQAPFSRDGADASWKPHRIGPDRLSTPPLRIRRKAPQ